MKAADLVLVLALDFYGANGYYADLGTITYIAPLTSMQECRTLKAHIEAQPGSGNLATYLQGSLTRYFAQNATQGGDTRVTVQELRCAE